MWIIFNAMFTIYGRRVQSNEVILVKELGFTSGPGGRSCSGAITDVRALHEEAALDKMSGDQEHFETPNNCDKATGKKKKKKQNKKSAVDMMSYNAEMMDTIQTMHEENRMETDFSGQGASEREDAKSFRNPLRSSARSVFGSSTKSEDTVRESLRSHEHVCPFEFEDSDAKTNMTKTKKKSKGKKKKAHG